MTQKGSRIFTIAEAAEILGVSDEYLRKLIDEGSIEAVIMRDQTTNRKKRHISESDLNKLSMIRNHRKWTEADDKIIRGVIDGLITLDAACGLLNRTKKACIIRIHRTKARDKRRKRSGLV